MALQAAADELYALSPEQFTAARDDFAARLRQAGERELATAVRELRRPTVPAWLVNVLVRHRAEDLDELLGIGEQLRSAMATGAGGEVRRLTDDRRAAVTRLTADLEALAGRPVPAGAAEEVRLTLEAATADPAAATAVRSGRLVRPLRYAGFGELPDLVGAVGLAPAPTIPPKQDSRRPKSAASAKAGERDQAERNQAERDQAERAVHEAAGTADDAQRAYEQRLAERAEAAAKVNAAAAAVTAAAGRLKEAQDQLALTREEEKNAAAAATAARAAARAAHATADAARRHLARLRSDPETNRRQ